MKRMTLAVLFSGLCCLWPAAATAQDAAKSAPQGTVASPAGSDPLDWTYWRGPQMNGISTEKNLPDSFNPEGGEGSNLLWKRTDLPSRSTPITMKGKLYMICPDKPNVPEEEGEKVVCLDAATGETIWETRFNVYLSDVPRERTGWSSVVGDPVSGDVFALGVCDYFACFDGATGRIKWEHSLHEEYGFLSTYGGRTNYPIVHETNVIVSAVVIGWGEMAKPTHRWFAFDKRNGEVVWINGTRVLPYDTTYSAPVLATFEGELAMVVGSGDGGVHAFQPRTGKTQWSYFVSSHGINDTPLVVGNRVYCGHAEENLDSTAMGAFFAIDGTKRGDVSQSGELWRVKELSVSRSTPVEVDGRLYVFDDGAKLHVLDARTGERVAYVRTKDRMMRGSPLYADGRIYACTMNGVWYVMEPTNDEKGVKILQELRLPGGEESHGSPIASHGRIYLPTTEAMYCLAKPDAEREAGPLPELPQDIEAPAGVDNVPAQVQVVPVEALLYPGDSQEHHVRLYNAAGRYLRNAKSSEVKFSIDGPGRVDANGKYTSNPKDQSHAAVALTATVGELTGKARIRQVPPLNWAFDFDNGDVPITWVGCQYRHIVLDYDLFKKLGQQAPAAAQLYLYVRTGFVNSGAPALTYDDSTPALAWTELLRFLQLLGTEDQPKTVEAARTRLGPWLTLLEEEQVIGSVEWSTWDRPAGEEGQAVKEPRLKVTAGTRKVDGNGVLCKISTIPKGMRSQGWMGHDTFSNYTIQADVLGAEKYGKLPDIGLIAQRYTLDLMGASQQLQIRSWTTQLDRFSATVPFAWQANTWYTLKFQAATEGGKAVLKGKVWKKGEAEPSDWMATGEDEVPNVIGSPGLFGNAKDAELFYDNVTVTENARPAEQPAGGE
jgi:outer membrane protein assembly factor BamB